MYNLPKMNHLPLNLEARFLVELMESWRNNEIIMLEIEQENHFSQLKMRRVNTYKANLKRRKTIEILLRQKSIREVAKLLSLTTTTVSRHERGTF